MHNTFFTDGFLTCVLAFMLILSISRHKKFPQLRLFPFYFGSFFLLQLYVVGNLLGFPSSYQRAINIGSLYLDAFVTLIEFAAFMYFLHYVIQDTRKKTWLKKATKFLIIAFLVVFIHNSVYWGEIQYGSISAVYVLEALCVLIGCFFYYRQLFTLFPNLNLMKQPDFWIATGLTFYAIGTLPITFLLNYYEKNDDLLYRQLFSVVYIFYILLYLMILKAYYCPTGKQHRSQSPEAPRDPDQTIAQLESLYEKAKRRYS